MLTKGGKLETVLNRFRKQVIDGSRKQLKLQKKNAFGKLSKSLDSNLEIFKNSFSLSFSMEEYGVYQDKGVSGTKKKYNTPFSYTTKRPPASKLDKWTVKRTIAPRDEKGRFITRKGLNFIIARSIYQKGIKPSLFFTKPFEKAFKQLPDDVVNAYALEVEDFLKFSLEK